PMTDAYLNNDHDRIDPEHFRALDRVVEYLAAKDVIADLIMFTTAEESFGTEEQDHRFARYLLARYAAYPNVIWCLTNEWNYTKRPIDYWNRLGRMMRSEDPWVERGKYIRGLSIHQQTRYDWNFFDQNWYSHVIVQLGVRNRGRARRDTDEWRASGGNRSEYFRHGDDWGYFSIMFNRGRGYPVVNDEYGYIGEPDDQTEGKGVALTRDKHRRVMWGIALAGGYGAAGDKTEYKHGRPYMNAVWEDTAEYGDIRHLIAFWTKRGIAYWRMSPAGNEKDLIAKRVYVLAEPGKEYVLYSAAGGRVELPVPGAGWLAERFDPRTGAVARIESGSTVDLPAGQDWVLHIRKRP
ncbi:MAG TPA: DUF4038 domain-containing protein, partial [Bryobacteraceae bacterium]|nr:DUF4038 domain-containing protein [Bryobacteraceae bacterium]